MTHESRKPLMAAQKSKYRKAMKAGSNARAMARNLESHGSIHNEVTDRNILTILNEVDRSGIAHKPQIMNDDGKPVKNSGIVWEKFRHPLMSKGQAPEYRCFVRVYDESSGGGESIPSAIYGQLKSNATWVSLSVKRYYES